MEKLRKRLSRFWKIKYALLSVGFLLLAIGVFFGHILYLKKVAADAINVRRNIVAQITSTPIRDIAKNKDLLRQALELLGVNPLMQKLVTDSNSGNAFDCHQEAHAIGRAGYELDKEKVFSECSASCHSGCYHGAMESFLHEKGTANIAAEVHEVCKIFQTSFSSFECLHGVGHGVLAYYDYDLPEALNQCGKLSTDFERASCYGGAFMENIITGQGYGANPNIHETEYLSDDPLFPCNDIDQSPTIQTECYKMQTSWMLTIFKYDFKKVANACLRVPGNMIHTCFLSYGRDAAGQTLRDPQKMANYCATIPEMYREDCVRGALNVVVDFWGPSLQNQAVDFCKILSGDEKSSCYATLRSRLDDLFTSNEERTAHCNNFESEYKNLCVFK